MNRETIIINGCFDCFHAGHQYLIHVARIWASKRVVVLLNSDSSVKRLKGIGRPINDFDTRVKNINEYWKSLHYLDLAHLELYAFNTEKQLAEIIDKLEPSMILKGNDRPDVREIVGSDKWPVCILPRLKDKDNKDISTTRKIEEFKSAQETDVK